MLVFTILFMIFLIMGLYQISQNLLFPAILFVGTWVLTLIGLLMSGDTFFEVSGMTYLVYLVGAISLSVGGVCGTILVTEPIKYRHVISVPQRSCWTCRALDILFIILLIGLPIYWQKVLSTVDDIGIDFLFQSIRAKAIESSGEGNTFGLIGNFVVLAQFVAVAMFYEMDDSFGRRWRALCSIILALVYGGMTGTKANAVVLLLTLFFISSIKRQKISVSALLGTLGIAATFFSLGLLVINFSGTSFSDAPEMIGSIIKLVQHYWLGGCVAFDQIVSNPDIMESTQPINRFFLETGRSLGMDIHVPFLHADYSMISPVLETNVYTIYFTYFKDFGWLGAVAIMFGLGASLSMLYDRAMKGGPIVVLFYATMCVAIVMSIFSEQFFIGLNGYIKFLIFLVIIYKVLPAIERSRFLLKVKHV